MWFSQLKQKCLSTDQKQRFNSLAQKLNRKNKKLNNRQIQYILFGRESAKYTEQQKLMRKAFLKIDELSKKIREIYKDYWNVPFKLKENVNKQRETKKRLAELKIEHHRLKNARINLKNKHTELYRKYKELKQKIPIKGKCDNIKHVKECRSILLEEWGKLFKTTSESEAKNSDTTNTTP